MGNAMQLNERSTVCKQYRMPAMWRASMKSIRVVRLATGATLLYLFTIQSVHADSDYSERINEIGLTLGTYSYKEPGLMSLQGVKAGVNLRSTIANPERSTFITSEVRFAGGTVDYQSNGTGSDSGEPDWYVEGRLLLGNTWSRRGLSNLSSYVGLGYRYLRNDGRGLTTTGHAGYRRESNYLYFPIGFIHRGKLNTGAKLVSTIEYDYLIKGKQNSHLSDVDPSFSDLENNQSDGYGWKLHMQYVTEKWSVGPYLHYWEIADSEIKPIYFNGAIGGFGLEPRNNTVELGIELRQTFE